MMCVRSLSFSTYQGFRSPDFGRSNQLKDNKFNSMRPNCPGLPIINPDFALQHHSLTHYTLPYVHAPAAKERGALAQATVDCEDGDFFNLSKIKVREYAYKGECPPYGQVLILQVSKTREMLVWLLCNSLIVIILGLFSHLNQFFKYAKHVLFHSVVIFFS